MKKQKENVRKFYGSIAKEVKKGGGSCCSCCSPSCCCGDVSNADMLYRKDGLHDLPDDAKRASLGCSDPITLAELKEGETVLDLGSGGGIDVLIASQSVGESGRIYGLDMTDEMLELANRNKEKMGVHNVEFLKGYIEDIPLADDTVDVIMSNCVINLSDDKEKVLAEAYRVLKPGGRLAIADIVTMHPVPDELREQAVVWSACLGGAMLVEEYKQKLEAAGFRDIEVTPVQIYDHNIVACCASEEMLQDIAQNIDLKELDNTFASAHVKARK